MKLKGVIQRTLLSLVQPIMTIFIALLLGSLLILLNGTNPLTAYYVMFKGALGNPKAIADSLSRATPLIFTGLSAAFAFKAGIFNIGQEGQLYWGALAATWVALTFNSLPSVILIPLCIFAGLIGGAMWALPAGLLNVKLDINILITTIMLNSIAPFITEYFVAYPMKGELNVNASFKVPEAARFIRLLPPSQLNLGFIIAVLTGIIIFIYILKTAYGFELRSIGENIKFADYFGVPIKSKVMLTMMFSGAIAGLAGVEQVLGFHYRFLAGFSPGYGFTGITAALLGRLNPISTIISAIFLGILEAGALKMEIMTDISRDLTIVVQAVIILMFGAQYLIRFKNKNNKKVKEE
jgi:simple sugar transport system permease protein